MVADNFDLPPRPVRRASALLLDTDDIASSLRSGIHFDLYLWVPAPVLARLLGVCWDRRLRPPNGGDGSPIDIASNNSRS